MSRSRAAAPGRLDELRMRDGPDGLRAFFHDLRGRDAGQAIGLLGDAGLQFPTLYALRAELTGIGSDPGLSGRNRRALRLAADLPARAYRAEEGDPPVLRWMLMTGCGECGLGDGYDRLMDLTAVLLVRELRDTACLPPLLDMIFARHRRGLNTLDAEWAFFECGDSACLTQTAAYLRSPDPADRELARRLLGFIPGTQAQDDGACHRQVAQWLDANRPYLRYTGESGHSGFNPARFRVCGDLKYIQRPLAAGREQPAITPGEKALLDGFAALGEDERELLSEYSGALRRKSRARWQRWMRLSPDGQLREAGAAVRREEPR